MSIYVGNWQSIEGVIEDFKAHGLQDSEVVFARYSYEAYEGEAIVIFIRDGKLYEVHGSHCSCYGLEDQWKPEETTLEVLRMREADRDFPNEWAVALDAIGERTA